MKSDKDPESLVADISRLRSYGINVLSINDQSIQNYVNWVKNIKVIKKLKLLL